MRTAILLEERVGIKINTDDIRRRVVQIEVAGVDTHNEGHGGTQHISQHQRAQGDVGALPLQWEDHLKHQEVRSSEQKVGGAREKRSLALGGWCLLGETVGGGLQRRVPDGSCMSL